MNPERRQLGSTELRVAPVAFGAWPITGVTTAGTNDDASVATVQAAAEAGINHIDTAYVYGENGESDHLIRRAIDGRRDEFLIASKVGIHWEHGQMVQDARPATTRAECDELLSRLATDRVELLYLHSPDPNVPIEESAQALGDLQREGKTVTVGASNCSLDQLQSFHAVTPLAAVQLPYNMLQRDIERKTIPWCREQGVAVMVYWPLMKGLLAGKLPRDHVFADDDSRRNYPMYQGDEWHKNQDFLDELRVIAATSGHTVAQLVIAWTIAQPGITAALCGAKRPEQIRETAAAMQMPLTAEQHTAIAAAIKRRGPAAAKRNFE